jgi:hypothetical protein
VNNIDKVRNSLKEHFKEVTIDEKSKETVFSPSRKYRVDTFINGCYTFVKIYNEILNERIFEFIVNEDTLRHSWAITNEIEYLICAEDIYGGQTIIDLTNKKIEGYSPQVEGFIWTDFFLSPDGTKLATIGCFWACPFVVKIYDFTDPLKLPLRELQEIELLDNDEVIVEWIDNSTLQMKGVKREREPEYFDGGSMRMNIINETKIERQIKIFGTLS